MTWAPDGRATFEYGDEVQSGEPHVTWRRIGTHSVFRRALMSTRSDYSFSGPSGE